MDLPKSPPLRSAAFLVLFSLLPAGAAFAQILEPPLEVTLDFDRDGRMDRATLVAGAEDGTLDLRVHFGADNGARPDFVKPSISDERILAFESGDKHSLTLMTCYGCGAIKSTEATMTLVFRDDTLLVAGYKRGWDWNTQLANGDVDTMVGGCEIDFLTGKGLVDVGIDDMQPVKVHFAPIALADWSFDKAPAICKFGDEGK